jgi:hypothetical protein
VDWVHGTHFRNLLALQEGFQDAETVGGLIWWAHLATGWVCLFLLPQLSFSVTLKKYSLLLPSGSK